MSGNLGLYLHIPFCKSKCPYCDFFSERADKNTYEKYSQKLIEAIESWGAKCAKTVDTVYFGGGTPSVLGADLIFMILESIYRSFKVAPDAEITMEANPSSGKFFDFEKAKSAGVNRVSLGVQSANENELKKLGRLHSPSDVINTVNLIKKSGIGNISLDLMLGIPEQTKESLKKSIDFCAKLDVRHISAYILKIEENTFFYKNREKYTFPDDEAAADLYLFAVEYLAQKGFNQYEISNFRKEGFESRHNLKYWKLDDYLGLGAGAHSFLDGKRFYFNRSFEDFYKNRTVDDGIGLTAEEYIMLRLRLSEGLNLKKYKEVFGCIPDKDFFKKVKLFCESGFAQFDGETLKLSAKGFLVSNTIISSLIQ